MYEYVLFDLDGTLMDPKEEIKETKIYPGIEQLLYNLKERGVRMAIVADKPQEVIERILKDFEIETYFSVVAGCEKDGMRENKEEVLEEAISRMKKKAGRRWKKEKILHWIR